MGRAAAQLNQPGKEGVSVLLEDFKQSHQLRMLQEEIPCIKLRIGPLQV